MHHTRIILISTLAALALVGAGCPKKQTSAPGGAISPSVAGTPKETSDVPVTVDVQGDGGTVTIKDDTTSPAPEDPKAGLKVYESKEFGFKVELPEKLPIKVEHRTFEWVPLKYDVVDYQVQDKLDGSYTGVFAFEITQNPEKLSLKEWIKKNNKTNDPFTIKERTFGKIPGVFLEYPENFEGGLGDLAYPPSPVIFLDPTKTRVFFMTRGQDLSVLDDYGVTADAFVESIAKTLTFTK